MKGNLRLLGIALFFVGVISVACGADVGNPPLPTSSQPSPTPISSRTPEPSSTPKLKPTTISTTLGCSDIVQALKAGDLAWSEFYASSIGAPIQFTGYIFEIDFEKKIISVYSDECQLEIWLKGIPRSVVIYLSYTQSVSGTGTIEGYPDLIYMDEVLVDVDLSTLVIR